VTALDQSQRQHYVAKGVARRGAIAGNYILYGIERPDRLFSVHVRYMLSPVRLSVCLSVCRLSVTLVCATQAVEIFGNISTAFGTLAIL